MREANGFGPGERRGREEGERYGEVVMGRGRDRRIGKEGERRDM